MKNIRKPGGLVRAHMVARGKKSNSDQFKQKGILLGHIKKKIPASFRYG